ncbi:cupin domain-containing protein [Gordonia sputi]
MLSRCIAIDPDTFARDHWGRRPLLSRSDALPRDFDDFLSPRSVDELIAERGVRAPFIRMAKEGGLVGKENYLGPAGFGAEMPDQVDSAKVLAQFASGATIVLQGLHRLWPPIIDFVRGMVDDLGHPVQANAYITPPANRGFDPHYDVHDVFVLQISGRKHWRVHAPVHTDPLADQPWTDHRDAIAARSHDEPVIDTVLEPGDALYLPRGWLHSAEALGHTSIHLTVGVSAVTAFDLVRAVVDQLGTVESLRTALPMGTDFTDPDESAALAAKTIAAVVDVLQANTTDLAESTAARLSKIHAERTRPVAVRPLATLDAVNSLSEHTTVSRRHGLVVEVRRALQRTEIHLPDRTISFPDYCTEALEAAISGATVTAGELPGIDTADGLVLIRRLLREGVVVLDDRSVPTG